MALTKERWVVMDASASLDGQYEEVACCYCSEDAFFYIDLYCDEDSHVEDKSLQGIHSLMTTLVFDP